jgi:transposase
VIDVFVDGLNLGALGFGGVDPKATGRPSYHSSCLLKLYIYGYLNRVQSSRRLEREAGRNVEVMWLTRRLAPDHKTIADFRKNNGRAIREVCARFVALFRAMGLLTQASVAIDGSKFKAVNNRDKNFTRAKMEWRMTQIEESVARYLQQLDSADRQEPSETLKIKAGRLKEKIEKLKGEMRRLDTLKARMLATPDQQISLTDPDARSMATSGRGSGVVGYNVQTAVDTKHHLIVAHEVTNVGTDRSQLANMAKQAKATLETESLDGHSHVGNFYLSSSQFAVGRPSQNQPVAPRPTEPKWPRNRLYSANVTMPSKLITTLRIRYRQHRARRVAQHAFRRTAAQIVEQPVVPRRCHDDEIGADLLRYLEDGFDDRPPSQIDVREEIAKGWQRLADMNHVKLRYRLQHAHHVGG